MTYRNLPLLSKFILLPLVMLWCSNGFERRWKWKNH